MLKDKGNVVANKFLTEHLVKKDYSEALRFNVVCPVGF